jgi:hypothetical protein
MDYKVYKSITELGESTWDRYVSKRFFLSYNYLATLEKACQQLDYRYVLTLDGGKFVSLCYFQIIPFSGTSLDQYLPTSNYFFGKLYENTLAKVRTNLLVLGNVIFTCENGVLVAEEYKDSAEEYIQQSLSLVLKTMDKKPLGTMISENIKSVSTKMFCPKRFHVFQVEDRMELNLGEFNSFNSYLDKFQSKYRVRVKKVLELNQNTQVISIYKENFSEYRAQIERLFLNVLDNSKFKLTTISVDYFNQFLLNVERFKMKGYMIDNQLIGFISYFQLDTIIEVHYAGLDYTANQKSKIYNFMLVDMIQEAFKINVKRICFGRTAQELKSTLGAQPFPTVSSLKINKGLLNLLTPVFLNNMVPEKWVQRSPFKSQ